jgi:phenylalanyl-tRNA synthetase beta chain
MKISLNWLRDFVNIPKDTDPEKLAQLFTIRTAEVEGVENLAAAFDNMVVGQILEIHPHPDADKLKVTKTSVGLEDKHLLQIVCGASNIYEGMYVAVALPGSRVRWHGEGDPVTLEPAKIRGVESFGMICAGDEIGIEEKSTGVVDLSTLKPHVGMPLAELLGKDDVILHIDNKSLTHRPDLWGHYGIAREISAITGEPLKQLVTTVNYPQNDVQNAAVGTEPGPLKVTVKDKKLCPRYIGVLVENVKIGPSPDWVQKRLRAIGYRPINNVVDATNYIMAEVGQPMHAFDADKIKDGIVVRVSKKDEKIVTLDGTERELPTKTLVIADAEKAVAIAGVMGGANSEVTPETTHLILESANFHPSSVRKTSVKLGLRSEAVMRFEKSLDPNLADLAMDRLCRLILEICPGARIASPKSDVKNFKEKATVINLNLKKVFSKIGKDIALEEVNTILTRLGFKILKSSATRLKVEVPSCRPVKDIEIEDDLVEEIARMHGYENIEPVLPELPIKLPLENKERKLKHYARQIMSLGLGFDEVYNYSFYSRNDIAKSLLPEELHERLENILSEDQTHMRVSLVPNMLKNVAHNLKSFDSFKIYEIGRTYEDLQEYFPKEEKKICAMVVRSGASKDGANPGKDGTGVFHEAKGALEKFLESCRAPAWEMKKGESLCTYAHPAKYAGYFLKSDGREIAKLYELHPLVLKNHGLEKTSVAAFEINFTLLASLEPKATKYKPLPRFPGIEIDVSVMVDKNTEVGRLQKIVVESDKTLVREVRLFDSYEGPNLPEGKKSFAFKILLQSDERTLTDAEMKGVQQKIFDGLKAAGGAIRGL